MWPRGQTPQAGTSKRTCRAEPAPRLSPVSPRISRCRTSSGSQPTDTRAATSHRAYASRRIRAIITLPCTIQPDDMDYLGSGSKIGSTSVHSSEGRRQTATVISLWGSVNVALRHSIRSPETYGRPTETSAGPPKGVFSTEAMVPSICSPRWLANPAYLVSCAATPLFSPRPPCCKAHPQTTVRHPTIRQRNIVDIN